MANHNKITIGRHFSYANKLKREFYSIVQYPELLSTVFSVKNPDGSNVIGEDGRPDVHKSQGWTYVLTLWELVTVAVVFDGRYDLSPACRQLSSRDHSYYLTSSKVFLLLIILQVVR